MAPADTTAEDTLLSTGESIYYVVTAVDAVGHESEPSAEGSCLVTGVFDEPSDPIPRSPHVLHVYPNPFNWSTLIEVDLDAGVALPASVRVEIFDPGTSCCE